MITLDTFVQDEKWHVFIATGEAISVDNVNLLQPVINNVDDIDVGKVHTLIKFVQPEM